MSIKQITVAIDGYTGTLSDMAAALEAKNANIRALTIQESGSFKTARIIADNVLWVSSALWEAGFAANMSDVVAVKVPDESGGLSRVLGVIERSGVGIKYMYHVICRNENASQEGISLLVFRPYDIAKAEDALKVEGIRVLSQGDLSVL